MITALKILFIFLFSFLSLIELYPEANKRQARIEILAWISTQLSANPNRKWL